MNLEPTDAAEGMNRRKFLRTAALTGAVAWTAPGALGDPPVEAAPSVTSLRRPSAPGVPGAIPLAPPDKQPPTLDVPEPRKKLGWAVVGLGELSLEEILPAFGECRHSRPVALVSGHAEKARRLAEVYGVDSKAVYDYAGYDRLRDHPEVDVVYIVLPNSLHADFTIRGLQAGKHVLCEKPMATSVAECEAMIAAAGKADRKLGVAYRLHYEPMNLAVEQMCRKKKFGEVKTFTASNCQDVKAPNIRLSGPLGGGPVGDVGIYCINAARTMIGEEPIEALAIQTQPKSDPRFTEVPQSVSFLLRFASGVIAECECSFGTARSSSYQVLCEKGSITMNPAYTYEGLHLSTESEMEGVPTKTDWRLPAINQFAAEMDAFSECVRNGQPIRTPGEMGLLDLRVILAVMESAQRGGAVVKVG